MSSPQFINYFGRAGPIDNNTHLGRIFDHYTHHRERRKLWLEDRRQELKAQAHMTVLSRVRLFRAKACASRFGDPILSVEGRFAAKVRADARKHALPLQFRTAHLPKKVARTQPPPSLWQPETPAPSFGFSFLSQATLDLNAAPSLPTYIPPGDEGRIMYDGQKLTPLEICALDKRRNAIAIAYCQAMQERKQREKERKERANRVQKLQHCLWSMRELEILPVDEFYIQQLHAERPKQHRWPVYGFYPMYPPYINHVMQNREYVQGYPVASLLRQSHSASVSEAGVFSQASTLVAASEYAEDSMDLDPPCRNKKKGAKGQEAQKTGKLPEIRHIEHMSKETLKHYLREEGDWRPNSYVSAFFREVRAQFSIIAPGEAFPRSNHNSSGASSPVAKQRHNQGKGHKKSQDSNSSSRNGSGTNHHNHHSKHRNGPIKQGSQSDHQKRHKKHRPRK